MDNATTLHIDEDTAVAQEGSDACPICSEVMPIHLLNAHATECLDLQMAREFDEPLQAPSAINRSAYKPPVVDEEGDEECLICMETRPKKEFTTLNCSHRFCNECLVSHITVCVENGKAASITCCNPQCVYVLYEFEISSIVGPGTDIYLRYMAFAEIQRNNRDPFMRWCPTPGCGTAVKMQKGVKTRLDCGECGNFFCGTCNLPHDPTTSSCKKARRKALRKNKNEKKVQKWARKHTQICPSCGDSVEHGGGCHTMRCIRCRTKFCYHCGESLDTAKQHCVGKRMTKGIVALLSIPPIIVVGCSLIVPGLILAVPVGVPVAVAIAVPAIGVNAIKEKRKKSQIAAGTYRPKPPKRSLWERALEGMFNDGLLVFGVDQE